MIVYRIDVKAQNEVVTNARKELGVHEIPDGSNDGPDVHRIQSSTGAYRAPWCVSFVQYVWFESFQVYLADRSANAYYLASWAEKEALTIPQAVVGCPVVYHVGDGHCGIVASVRPDGTFDAIEGNEANAVRWVVRNPRAIPCTFILPDQLKAVLAWADGKFHTQSGFHDWLTKHGGNLQDFAKNHPAAYAKLQTLPA